MYRLLPSFPSLPRLAAQADRENLCHRVGAAPTGEAFDLFALADDGRWDMILEYSAMTLQNEKTVIDCAHYDIPPNAVHQKFAARGQPRFQEVLLTQTLLESTPLPKELLGVVKEYHYGVFENAEEALEAINEFLKVYPQGSTAFQGSQAPFRNVLLAAKDIADENGRFKMALRAKMQ